MPIYMKLMDRERRHVIRGGAESTMGASPAARSHEDWIFVDSASWGGAGPAPTGARGQVALGDIIMVRQVDSALPAGRGRFDPPVSDLVVVRQLDRASPLLRAAAGHHRKLICTIDFLTGDFVRQLSLTATDAVISDYRITRQGGNQI